MKIAVCFLSTSENHFNFIYLKQQALASKLYQIDIYEYINNEKNDYANNGNIVYFNYEYLRKKFNYNYYYVNTYSSVQQNAGIQFLTLLDMYDNHKTEYDIYLFYEDDLAYFGTENLFDRIDFNCDALFQDKRLDAIKDNWHWLLSYYNNSIDEPVYHGLLNIYALNSKAINGLINYYLSGHHCHHEGLISTYILNNGYKVNYVNDYVSLYADCLDTVKVNNKCELIHPIKTIEKYYSMKTQTINGISN